MAGQIIVHKNRTNVVTVDLGSDVSTDTFTSEIRVGKSQTSTLLATWTVTFITDGTDGKLKLTLDNSQLTNIAKASGYMDIKRTTNGEPIAIFDEPLEVIFRDTVTA